MLLARVSIVVDVRGHIDQVFGERYLGLLPALPGGRNAGAEERRGASKVQTTGRIGYRKSSLREI
jgi:hypothetical protein